MGVLEILDPTGRTRNIDLDQDISIGRNPELCELVLHDPTAAPLAAVWNQAERRIRAAEGAPDLQLGDLYVREAHWPTNVGLKIGDSTLKWLGPAHIQDLPQFPLGIVPWLTNSPQGHKVLWMIKKSAQTSLSIYLAGETGTGKEVLAHLIHAWSDRASGPFIPLHCSALPLSLVESELFGHAKGAFTGAHRQRPGALLQAHGGTLFLDEVGDLPQEIQIKLLRFLEDGEIRPVGADQCVHANVRLLCATHLPLLELVEKGTFRRDLYYRIASVTIPIPPLRVRMDDIALLAQRFAAQHQKTISQKAIYRLQVHPWPGNVRELRHSVERACGLAGPFVTELKEDSFEFLITRETVQTEPEVQFGASVLTLREMQRAMLLRALRLSHGNRRNAAKILGVARSTLFEMLKRHNIRGPRSQPLLPPQDQAA